ncbi:MAG: 3-deoxy-7-phosphoheptulonate synthase [Candidatus Aenigmarchaeota archaeon]|nr:3-deoxy-7-phosphoheptulonate synthase [Candidatus Aenigmarchaeota archaeon]
MAKDGKSKKEHVRVMVRNFEVGSDELFIIAGPCSVESRDHIIEMAYLVRGAGADALRGGAFKPRTEAGKFDGLKENGLRYLVEAREKTGLPIVTEIMAIEDIPLFQQYGVDVYQVGTRNAQNFPLLHALGDLGVTVLLKRGMGNKVEEWLGAASHVVSRRNKNLILCERGVSTFDSKLFRNMADIAGMAYAEMEDKYPVLFDPSHATGIRKLVRPMSRAAVTAGADGLLIEVHDDPNYAKTDGQQSIYPRELEFLIKEARRLRAEYIDSTAGHEKWMEKLQPNMTIYFQKEYLDDVCALLGSDAERLRVRSYGEDTGILQARVKTGHVGKLKQKGGYAIGRLSMWSSGPGEPATIPMASVEAGGQPKTILTLYDKELLEDAGKKTIDQRYTHLRRLQVRQSHPGDLELIAKAFTTYTDRPLILYQP